MKTIASRILKAARLLLAAPNNLVQSLRKKYPAIPLYVLKELCNGNNWRAQHVEEATQDETVIQFSKLTWKNQVVSISFSDFCADTQRRMLERQFGKINPYGVPNDEARMNTQRKLVQSGRNEPVILIKEHGQYELHEGWHRTMNLLLLGKTEDKDPTKWNKVKINAWIGEKS